MTGLRIADDLELPLEAVTETFAILAKRGGGKTYTAAVMAEEMLDAGLPVCIVDPLGVWFGLRSSADGKTEGYPVVIFGGEHADVPLEETAGPLIADVIIDQRFPAVLDLSLLNKSAMRRFMTAFLGRLYHRNRDALHVIIDEADLFAPQARQERSAGDGPTLLGAMEDLVRRGRARGIGCTLITQRPAVLHKDVLSQAEVLICLRMTGVRDVNAIDEWVKLHADDDQARELKHSLPALPIGTAWVWSPGWLGILQQIAVRRRRTFDSSATPKLGERRIEPRKRADVDLESLGAQIAATVERAKADDPRELRRRITTLERDLATAKADVPEPVEIRVEVPVLDEQLATRLMGTLADLHKHGEEVSATATDMLERLSRWEPPHPGHTTQPKRPIRPDHATKAPVTGRPSGSRAGTATPPVARLQQPPLARSGDGPTDLGKGERTILTAIAQYEHGVTREQLTVLTGYKRSSRDTYLQRLRAAVLVDVTGGTIRATDTGIDALGGDYEPLPTGAALRDHWLATLPEGERRILGVLIDAWPDPVARDDISETTGYKRSSRDTYLQRLRARQLITTTGTAVTAVDTLFDGGRP